MVVMVVFWVSTRFVGFVHHVVFKTEHNIS